MKISYEWLREWVRVPWEARELGSRLTLAGFELEAFEPAAPAFSGVVVGEILDVSAHPAAQKLRVCRVASGRGEPVQIVCGASNARAGLRSALAIAGAMLPDARRIEAAKLRGVDSQGMLCSAKELGLAAGGEGEGILELPADAPLGEDLREYLRLNDCVLELNVTPNRGDAMSVLGIAREAAALSGEPLTGPRIEPVAGRNTDEVGVQLHAPVACPKFVARVLRGLNNRAPTPEWLRERLRRAGLRCISPVVDVTNYVMLELGQPMHAYDLARLRGGVQARLAHSGESLTLLDGQTVKLEPDMLVIADEEGAVGLAGVMGGARTAVGPGTVDVLLESAYFAPEAVAGRARRLGLHTDASQRFERGVDPAHQERAVERVTALLYQTAGGSPGATTVTQAPEYLPRRLPVRLRRAQLARLLGAPVAPERVEAVFAALQMSVARTTEGWAVTPPSHRFDITIEADLIEEVARIIGYEEIREADALAPQRFKPAPEELPAERSVLDSLAARGYHEVITYAFVDPALQARLFPEEPSLTISNPIASDLSAMRVSLWPGLIRVALENQRRQRERLRLVEHGARFALADASVHETDSLGGLVLGGRHPEQWGTADTAKLAADFFDVKADVECLLAATGDPEAFAFEPALRSCLHPGRSARILRRGAPVGWLGELHPTITRDLGFTAAPIVFELDWAAALRGRLPQAREISRFPLIRRDIAVVIDESVPLSALRERVTLTASNLLQDVRVFDVYRGAGIEKGRKSVALGLIFQHISRTLTDDDVDRAVAAVVADLRAQLGARLRE